MSLPSRTIRGALGAMYCLAATMLSTSARTAATGEAFTPINQRQVAAGAFCLSELPPGSTFQGPASPADRHNWAPTKVVINRSGTGARLTLYAAPVDWESLGAVDCDKVSGHQVILSGALNAGSTMTLQIEAGGTWKQILPQSIDLALGHVTVKSLPTLGGTVSFVDRQLWLKNAEVIDIRKGAATHGYVRLEVTDTGIKHAQLQLGSMASRVPVDLLVTGKNVFFNYNLENGALNFAEGELVSKPAQLAPEHINLAGLTLDSTGIHAHQILLTAVDSHLTATLVGVTVATTSLTHGPLLPVVASVRKGLAINSLSGTVPQADDVALITQATFTDLTADADQLVLYDNDGKEDLSGPAKLSLAQLSDTRVAGRLQFGLTTWNTFSKLSSSMEFRTLDLDLSGEKATPTIGGSGVLEHVTLAGLGFKNISLTRDLKFGPSKIDAAFHIPFAVDVPQAKASLELADPASGSLWLQGEIDRFHLAGDVAIAQGNPTITLPADGMSIDVGGALAAHPLIYGSKPVFAKGALQLSTRTSLEITPVARHGEVQFAAQGLLIPSPEMHFDTGGFRINLPLETSLSAALSLDLADGAWRLCTGTFDLIGIDAATPDNAPVSFDALQLNGAQLQMASLHLQAKDNVLAVQGSGLNLSATHVTHTSNPALSADLTQPITLTEFEVVAEQRDSKLVIRDVRGGPFQFSSDNLTYTSGDGFSAHAKAVVSADTFSLNDVHNLALVMSNGEATATGTVNGHVNLRTLQLKADGPKDSLSGKAHLALDGLSLQARIPVHLVSECPAMMFRANANVGDVSMDATLTNGNLQGEAGVPNVEFHVREDGAFACGFDRTQHIKDQWTLFSVPCMNGFKISMCDVKAGPIDATIHWDVHVSYFEVSAIAQDTKIRLMGSKGIKTCGGTLRNLKGPWVAGSYVPDFNHSIPFISDVIDDLIIGIGYAFETPIAATLGGLASLTNIFYQPDLLGGC